VCVCVCVRVCLPSAPPSTATDPCVLRMHTYVHTYAHTYAHTCVHTYVQYSTYHKCVHIKCSAWDDSFGIEHVEEEEQEGKTHFNTVAELTDFLRKRLVCWATNPADTEASSPSRFSEASLTLTLAHTCIHTYLQCTYHTYILHTYRHGLVEESQKSTSAETKNDFQKATSTTWETMELIQQVLTLSSLN
jgi:hypothetical protein